jgi:MinD-like ATPase involved in chromosome partitioning or flagellar assembly
MSLIAIASDKGAPGVTTAALALASVWPRPVLLAECDPSGGDLAYRFPAASGGHLDPRRGVLSLAVTARRGMQPNQVWEHVQKLHGGLDVLAGVTNAEQGAGLNQLWGPIGKVLAGLAQADVIADCGRLGAEGPVYDLLAEASVVLLVTKAGVGDVIRLRDRAAAVAAGAESRGRRGFGAAVLVVADTRKFAAALGEVQHVLRQAGVPATVIGGLAHDAKGAAMLGGGLVGKLDRTMLIRTTRDIAQQLVRGLPSAPDAPAANAPGTNLSPRVTAANTPGPAFPRAAAGTTAVRQGRHQASPQTPSPPSPQSPPSTPSPPGTQSSLAAEAPAGQTQSDHDWAGAERLKWRERERQQSGGV